MKREDTRNHILDTALDLFWQQSYHGVNMNALSRAAGLNKATVYQYFASKEELAVAAVQRAAELSEDYIYASTLAETADPLGRLNGIYTKVYDMHASMHRSEGRCRGCPFVNIGVELATTTEEIRIGVGRAFARFTKYYQAIADELPAAGDKSDLGASLMANMNGCLVASKIENRPEAILDGQARALRIVGL